MTTNTGTGKYYIYVLLPVYIYAYVYTAMVWLLIPVSTKRLYHTVVFPIILVQYT